METASTAARPSVLLLAGEVREAWERALVDSGFEVRVTGWLDAITAARMRRPDAVVVAHDLPEGAAPTLARTFSSAGSHAAPLLLACAPFDLGLASSPLPLLFPAVLPRWLPAPAEPAQVAEAVRRALSEAAAPTPLRLRTARALWVLAMALLLATPFLFLARLLGLPPGRETWRWVGLATTAAGLTTEAAGLALALADGGRFVLRSAFLWLMAGGALIGFSSSVAGQALVSAALLVGAVTWALGLRAEPRTPLRMLGRALVALLCLALAAVPLLLDGTRRP